MDCEKFDQIIIDALYDELDELTLAAAKRHTDGCQRCQTAWSGLRATRKIGVLPLVPAPVGLEERILAAAREAQQTVAWPKRVGRAVSRAGAYAMRPQTAMGVLFLVITGWALLFLRPKPDRSGAPSQVSVTERGVPELAFDEPRAKEEMRPMGERRGQRRDDDRAAASAAPGALALNDQTEGRGKGASAKNETFAEPAPAARARPVPAGAADSVPNEPLAELEKKSAGGVVGGVVGGGLGQASGAAAPLPASPAATTLAAPNAFTAAMDLYNQGRYADAEKAFNAVVVSGDKNAPSAALHAARSAEAAYGCANAAPKYESVAQRYPSSVGPDAMWEGANCYKASGQYQKARSMYVSLRSVAGFRDKAEVEIANLQPFVTASPAKPGATPKAAKQAAPAVHE